MQFHKSPNIKNAITPTAEKPYIIYVITSCFLSFIAHLLKLKNAIIAYIKHDKLKLKANTGIVGMNNKVLNIIPNTETDMLIMSYSLNLGFILIILQIRFAI